MYNNIGLTTPKGSGTNGYVQRNLAGLRAQRVDFKELNKSLKHGNPDFKPKAANPELLLHEQKRKVELDLIKLEDELKAAGMSEREIQDNVAKERKQMIRAVEDGQLHYDTQLEKKDSHQLAVDKQNEIDRFERAFGINRGNHVFGQAFDQELQAKMRLERMEQRAEQERIKLEAARKAEKAERRALKLRAKAEKAKKKAEAKLAKLKVKQEKRRIKKEQKAATKAELGVSRRGSKKEELDPDNDNGVAKATKIEKNKKGKKDKKDKKGGKKNKEESDEDDSSDSSDSDDSDSDSDSDSSDDSSDSSSSKPKKAKKKEKKQKEKAGKKATKNEAIHEHDKENQNNRPSKQNKESKEPVKQELGAEGKGREEAGKQRSPLRARDNRPPVDQRVAQRPHGNREEEEGQRCSDSGVNRDRDNDNNSRTADGTDHARRGDRDRGEPDSDRHDRNNSVDRGPRRRRGRSRDDSRRCSRPRSRGRSRDYSRGRSRDDSRRCSPARRHGDRRREDRRREERRHEDCSDSRERGTDHRDNGGRHGRDRDSDEHRGRLARHDRHDDAQRDNEGGRGSRRPHSEDSDPRGGRRQLREGQRAARSGRGVPDTAGQRGQQSRELAPPAAAVPRGGADMDDRRRHSAGAADWISEVDILDRRRNARGAADALLDEATELPRRSQEEERSGEAPVPRKREPTEREKQGVAKRAKKGKPAVVDPYGGCQQDFEGQDPDGSGPKAGLKAGTRLKKPVKVTKAGSKAGRAKARDGASGNKTEPDKTEACVAEKKVVRKKKVVDGLAGSRSAKASDVAARKVLRRKKRKGEAPEVKPEAIQKRQAKLATDRKLLGYGATHARSDDGSCSSSSGSESPSGSGSADRRVAAAAAAAATSWRRSRNKRLPSPP